MYRHIFADGTDYEEGPYNVTIPKGKMNATYCIAVPNDEELEMDEAFRITINENALDQDVVVMSPNEARVIILDDECKHKDCTFQYCV